MSALRTLANPEKFDGHEVRLAVDEQNFVWFAARDLTAAAGGNDISVPNLLNDLPESWLLKREGLPVMVNEAGAYCIATKLFEYNLADWLRQIIERERYGYRLQVISVNERINNTRLMIDVCEQLSAPRTELMRSVLIDALRDCCNGIGRRMPDVMV